MSEKLRSVNTKFWDDPFVEDLTPSEKLLFLYFLTNPLTNLLGIYEITIKRMCYDTGLNQDTVRKALERFEMVKKAFYQDNFIVLPNFLKNQRLNANMKTAVVREYDKLPKSLKTKYILNDSEWFGMVPNDSGMIREIEVEEETEIEEETEAHSDDNDFEMFWDLYDKKHGDKSKIEKKWLKLNSETRKAILDYIPKYKICTPEKIYRKNPETFLNNRGWLDELIYPTSKTNGYKHPAVLTAEFTEDDRARF